MKVIGMGEALWDILPEGKKIGGAPANFAYHVKQFGLDSCAVSAIGDDPLGKELVEQFDNKDITYHLDIVPYPTGTVLVTLDEARIPQYEIKENVAWDNIPYSDELKALAKDTKAVCFGSLAQRNIVSRETINRFIDDIPAENEPLIVFDINLRQHFYTKEVIQDSLRKCNILKINDEEMVVVSHLFGYPGLDLENIGWLILGKYNLSMLILTCGTRGSYVFTPGELSFMETPVIPEDELGDTVGAGDSFTAAFIAGILKGKSIREAHRMAVETSAFVCTQNGAMPTLPDSLTK